MKRSELKTMIRKIVREEVASAIHEVITELKEPTEVQPPEHVSEMEPTYINNNNNSNRQFSSNKVLNDVLNETANGDGWRTMGDKTYTSDSIGSILANQYKDIGDRGPDKISGEQMIESMGMNPETVPDHITKALSRDYSELLKLSKEKSRRRR